MPGVIMENGRNGSHTNHDRDQRPNGVNGATYVSEKTQDKGKGKAEPQQNVSPISPTVPNGLNGNLVDDSRRQNGGGDAISEDIQERINQLPPEIAHITQGYMPLSKLLSRLAQKTHSDLSSTILELAQMPVPASAVNGNAAHITAVDDNSVENLNKKLRMLKFAQDAHTEWTKALVITGWSRRAEDVSRTIDLKIHLDGQTQFYENALFELGEVKRGLIHARLPNPDLKTALEVLTTGKASWMPDVRCSST
jgi:mediator of RNA polymerase II transcription subunit 14